MRHVRHLALSVAIIPLIVFIPACSLERLMRSSADQPQGHSACFVCHRTSEPSSSDAVQPFAGGLDPSSACMDCHHYRTNHHPVDVAPDPGQNMSPTGFMPLFDGKVQCLTCHQAHREPARSDLDNPPMLLRGGPYADRLALCRFCHALDAQAKLDPHIMLAPDGGIRQVNDGPVCLVCHAAQPGPESSPYDVEFKADIAFLCLRCHAPMIGQSMSVHLHVKPSRATRQAMQRAERETGISLPLAVDGMLSCSTCHNPHQGEIAMRDAARAGSDKPHRLRISGKNPCKTCHTL